MNCVCAPRKRVCELSKPTFRRFAERTKRKSRDKLFLESVTQTLFIDFYAAEIEFVPCEFCNLTFYGLTLLTCCDTMFLPVSCSPRLAVPGVSFHVLSNCYSAKSCNFYDLRKRLDFIFPLVDFNKLLFPKC